MIPDLAESEHFSGIDPLQTSLGADSILAWLPDEGAAEILDGHPEVIFGVSFTPTGGRAIPVEGGYRLTGQ